MRLLLIAIASGAILCGLFSMVMCDGGYGGYSSYGNYGGMYSGGYGGQVYYDQGYGKGYTGMQGYGGKGGDSGYGGNYWALNVPYGISVPPIAPPLGVDQSGLYGATNRDSLWAVIGFGLLLWLLANSASNRAG